MKYISVCSGIEAATVAWHPLGWQPVAFGEIEPFPAAVLAHHYPDVPNLGDMAAINSDEWRDKVDVIVGGTPCQAFSVAGKRQSLADERGNLTLKFVELCDAIRPAFVVWENVPGALSLDDNAFGLFIGKLAGEAAPAEPGPCPEVGKSSKFWRWNRKIWRHIPKWPAAGWVTGSERTIAWRILDAQYFGVAQRRERLFLIGCPRDGADPREILFESDGVRRDFAPSRETREEVAGTLEASLGRSRGAGTPISALTASHWSGGPHPALSQSHNTGGIGMSNQELFSQGGAGLVAPTLNASFGTKQGLEDQHALGGAGLFVPHVSPALQSRDYKGVSCDTGGQTGALIAFHPTQDPIHSDNGSCHALGCGAGSGQATHAVAYGMQVRRLIPVECERLQGFPDGYTAIPWRNKSVEQCPDGPRYKALGNSMAVTVMRWIGERIQLAYSSNV